MLSQTGRRRQVSIREAIQRVLKELGFVRRRSRPVVGPEDPDDTGKLARTQRLLASLLRDEVDMYLNPKFGAMEMPKGSLPGVVMPGNNENCDMPGSLVWQTGTMITSPSGARRNTTLSLVELV